MAVEANEGRRLHGFCSGDKILLNTVKLLIGYTNVDSSSQKLQHHYAVPFTLGKQHRENALELTDFPPHWHLHNVFNVDQLKAYMADTSQARNHCRLCSRPHDMVMSGK